MASLSAIRDAIQAILVDNIAELEVYDTVPAVVNIPAVVVMPTGANFEQTSNRGFDEWTFDLYVLAQKARVDQGQDDLDSYVSGSGVNSVRQVIFENRSLELVGTDARVAGMDRYGGTFEAAGVEHIGAVLRLVVVTPGTV